jgi:hypothetical protein
MDFHCRPELQLDVSEFDSSIAHERGFKPATLARVFELFQRFAILQRSRQWFARLPSSQTSSGQKSTYCNSLNKPANRLPDKPQR